MSEAKFTAGPWVAESRQKDLIYIETDCLEVAQIWTDDDRELTAEDWADAHLIAAAPELYDALSFLVADCSDYEPWQRPCLAFDKAKAALAKALGEPTRSPARTPSTHSAR